MDEKILYRQKAEAQLKELKANIDKLKAKAKQANADARIQFNDQLKALDAHKDRVQENLSAMESAAGEAYEDLKSGTQKAFSELKSAVEKAAERFS